HWQAVDARWRAAALKAVEGAAADKQRAYADGLPLPAQAQALETRGQLAAALPLRLKALAISREVLGEEHPETAQHYNHLANLLHTLGKYADAEQNFRKALATGRKALGGEHPQIAGILNNLAGCHAARGKTAEAEQGFREALAINLNV